LVVNWGFPLIYHIAWDWYIFGSERENRWMNETRVDDDDADDDEWTIERKGWVEVRIVQGLWLSPLTATTSFTARKLLLLPGIVMYVGVLHS